MLSCCVHMPRMGSGSMDGCLFFFSGTNLYRPTLYGCTYVVVTSLLAIPSQESGIIECKPETENFRQYLVQWSPFSVQGREIFVLVYVFGGR